MDLKKNQHNTYQKFQNEGCRRKTLNYNKQKSRYFCIGFAPQTGLEPVTL